uniref:Phospholipase A2 n=1 Tax=Timema monikensis TaxID=170555 RepID=A0A7R9ECL7_9NEOP|nr:unnamed protein product [Timema monikensis]
MVSNLGVAMLIESGILSVDRPDPYLVLWTPGAPHGRRKTRTVKNTHRPVWDQCFDFMLDPQHDTELRVHLMDRGAAVDQLLGKVRVDISELPLDKELYQELRFPHNQGYSFNCRVNSSTSPDLRLSCDLSEEENNFLDRRRVRVKEALETYLGGEQAPRHVGEVPRVAVLGSGGGFRAMVAFSSVLKTLHEMGVFPCVTYLASLSGSSWYLSDLYSHPEFPTKSPGDLQLELQRKVTGGWKKVLCPKRMFRYLKAIHRKHKTGQPVSFTDLFGHMVGDLLLGERKTCTLSEQSGKLTKGELPLPMYTCLQVKKDVSARVYQVRNGGPCTRSSPDYKGALWEYRRCNIGSKHFFDAAPKYRQQTGRTDVTMLRYGDTKRRYAVTSKPYVVVLLRSVASYFDVSGWCWQDWLEFTPYEVGFSKHGASMKPPLFGNKLYLGRVTTPYKELPLHYLQGVWGSAYTIFFRRVIESGRRDALNPQQEDADDDSRLLRAGQTFKYSLSSRDDPKDQTSSSEGTTEGDEDSEVCTSSETETSSRQDLEEQRPQDTGMFLPQDTSMFLPQNTSVYLPQNTSIYLPQDTSMYFPQDTSMYLPQDTRHKYVLSTDHKYVLTTGPKYVLTTEHKYVLTTGHKYVLTTGHKYVLSTEHKYVLTTLHKYVLTTGHKYVLTTGHKYVLTTGNKCVLTTGHKYVLTTEHKYVLTTGHKCVLTTEHKYVLTTLHKCVLTTLHKCVLTTGHKYVLTTLHKYVLTTEHKYVLTTGHKYVLTTGHKYVLTTGHKYVLTTEHKYVLTTGHKYVLTTEHKYVLTTLHKCVLTTEHKYVLSTGHKCVLTTGHKYVLTTGHKYVLTTEHKYVLTTGHKYVLTTGHKYVLTTGHKYALTTGHKYVLTTEHKYVLTTGHKYVLTTGHKYVLTTEHKYVLTTGHRYVLTTGHKYVLTTGHKYVLTTGHKYVLTTGHRKLSRARSGRKKRKRDRTFWQMILSKLLRGRLFDSRSGRAGVVFNPVRGLQFCSPCAPYVGNTSTTTPDDDAALKETTNIRASRLVADVDFQGFYEPLTAHTKKLYLVDSGLTFNLPFPALLRPQRDVDVFLAFEFSNRAEDESSPFGELLLAEKWARLRNASFPPVSQQVEEFLKHPLRECYLFEDTEDPCCPVILFFVLINKCFRTHKDVGKDVALVMLFILF